MAKIISTFKAILTRIFFSAHSLIAIWQVTQNTGKIIYWSLCGPLVLLLFEGVFTLMIKKTQEWRWFCPSVFIYLSSIVPAIWLLEFDKIERRFSDKGTTANKTTSSPNSPLNTFDDILGETGIPMPKINEDTWTALIEQFLMLLLIVGRWMLPKGDLTRDQLSQLLLVYIGTAADIIEFFDSYKDDSIAQIPLLVYLTLGIWSWSLLQFTIVLSATRARRSRGSGTRHKDDQTDCCNNCCCGIDVWGIVLNVILQDAPFLTFRLLIIFQYRIINYMNVFFTCKNSLVIILQLYRLYVVNAEFWKNRREMKESQKSKHFKSNRRDRDDANSIYMISSERGTEMKRKIKRAKDYAEDDFEYKKKNKKDKDKDKNKNKKRKRKDTGYSTASSQNLYSTRVVNEKDTRHKNKKAKKSKRDSSSDNEVVQTKKSKNKKHADKSDKKKSKKNEAIVEETSSSSSSSSSDSSNSTLPSYEVINERKSKSKRRKRSTSSSSQTDSSDNSSSQST